MDLSRRRMLQGGVAMAALATSPLRWVGTALAAPAGTVSASWLSRATFVPLVGSQFGAGSGRSRTVLTLVAVRDLPSVPATDGRFSLLLRGPSTLRQGTWPLHHETLGDSTLFIVPIGPPTSVRNYEVIVNRPA